MSGILKSLLPLSLIGALLVGAGLVQQSLNRDRDRLGLTRVQPLENAPPVLAFTTVALGGFRGLISNALWMRASDLQDEDKFFEMAQLADWITEARAAFRPGVARAGLEHGLQHLRQVQGIQPRAISRPLALGQGRHRIAARRRPALQPERDAHLPRTGVVLPAQDRRRTSTTPACTTSSSGPRRWPRSLPRRQPEPGGADPSPDARTRRSAPGCCARRTRWTRSS